jgi:hypothetical protein
MQTPIGVEIGGGCDQLLLHCNRAYKIDKKRLTASEFANDQAETRSTVGNPGDIFHQRLDFFSAPYLDQVLSGAGYHAGA